MSIPIKKIAKLIDGTIQGDDSAIITCISKIDDSKKNSLTFLANLKYEKHLYNTKAACVIIDKNFKPSKKINTSLIRVKNPYNKFASILSLFNFNGMKTGIHSSATVSKNAQIGKNVFIGAKCFIDENVIIKNNSRIYANCYIGKNSFIGKNSTLYSGVNIYHNCKIGNNCTLHSGAIIGSDGFGFAPINNSYSKIEQIGNVIIKDHVEIGANTTIDRATIGSTIIQNGVKLDNLIQVAHNVEIGENTVIAALTGIAGSVKIGKNCMIGGHVAINGHITIADNVKISAKAGVTKSILKQGAIIQGYWAFDRIKHQRSYIHFKNLPDIVKRIDKLEDK